MDDLNRSPYSDNEYYNMLHVYFLNGGCVAGAIRSYRELHGHHGARIPGPHVFNRLIARIREPGALQPRRVYVGRPSSDDDEPAPLKGTALKVMKLVEEDPTRSMRDMGRRLGISHVRVHAILKARRTGTVPAPPPPRRRLRRATVAARLLTQRTARRQNHNKRRENSSDSDDGKPVSKVKPKKRPRKVEVNTKKSLEKKSKHHMISEVGVEFENPERAEAGRISESSEDEEPLQRLRVREDPDYEEETGDLEDQNPTGVSKFKTKKRLIKKELNTKKSLDKKGKHHTVSKVGVKFENPERAEAGGVSENWKDEEQPEQPRVKEDPDDERETGDPEDQYLVYAPNPTGGMQVDPLVTVPAPLMEQVKSEEQPVDTVKVEPGEGD